MHIRELISVVTLAIFLGGACSSAAEPGAQGVLNQADKALMTQVEAALRDVSAAESAYQATNGAFTTDLAALGINPPADVTLSPVSADATSYCIEATHAKLEGTWHIASDAPVVTEGSC